MHKILEEFTPDWQPLQKTGILIVLVFLSLSPFVQMIVIAKEDYWPALWKLRYFIGLAILQASAQVALGLYVHHNKLPNAVVYSILCMAINFQIILGINIALIAQF